MAGTNEPTQLLGFRSCKNFEFLTCFVWLCCYLPAIVAIRSTVFGLVSTMCLSSVVGGATSLAISVFLEFRTGISEKS